MNASALTTALKEKSLELRFDLVAATPAVRPADFDRFAQWLAQGYAGSMQYLADRLDAYRHPGQILDGAKSILMLGMNYRTVEPVAAGPGQARISRYAWGVDYHELIRGRLHALADYHRQLVPGSRVRGIVDTAPLLERYFGQQAGLGWIGKNNLLIHARFGSWFFLAALLSTEELVYDRPQVSDPCGTCRACLDACPTGALIGPRLLDARKCISYLTIESRAANPAELQKTCGDRFFGCDACQEACPWNRLTPSTSEPAFQPGPDMNPLTLADLAALDPAALQKRFRHTPLWRIRMTL
jgi:epoxyqueuosine reductase